MTFDEIVTEVAARVNLTSTTALTRIGREVNMRYKRVTSGCYLDTSRRVTVSAGTLVDSREVVFELVEKVLTVYYKSGDQNIVLDQVTPDQITLEGTDATGTPIAWAVVTQDSDFTVINLDCLAADIMTLYADGISTTEDLANSDEPVFPQSFHDLLVEGAVADEWKKMNKMQDAKQAEFDYERRLSDLRMFLARTTYLSVQQGNAKSVRENRNIRNRMV